MVAFPKSDRARSRMCRELLGESERSHFRRHDEVAGRCHRAHRSDLSRRRPRLRWLVHSPAGRRIGFPDDFGELEQSALKEVGNILVGAYVNALSEFMGMMLIMSVPALAIDTAAAVLTTSYLNFGSDSDYVFASTRI